MQSRHSTIGGMAAVLIAGVVSAQTTQPTPSHDHSAVQSGSPGAANDAGAQPLTVTGCLMRRPDAAGRVSAGTADPDAAPVFVVAAVRTSGHHVGGLGGMRPSAANAAASGGSHNHNPQPVGTSGTATNPDGGGDLTAETQMFTIAGVASAGLAQLAGKRVEITGRIDTAAVEDTQPTSTDPASATLVQTENDVDPDAAPLIVQTIRAVDGACPASQN